MPIRALVVDDSALMRRVLVDVLAGAGLEVAAARDGGDALARIRELDPDVVTLDVNMPVMDGLTCLSRIMTESPRPVVMVSSLTHEGALATLEALHMGAVDFVPKPGGTVSRNLREIDGLVVAKVLAAARARVRRAPGPAAGAHALHAGAPAAAPAKPRPAPPRPDAGAEGLVLVGASTGGPQTLEVVLGALPGDLPWPVVVAQHMPAHFTRPLAERLDPMCELRVRELTTAQPLAPGTIWIARGGADAIVSRRRGSPWACAAAADDRYRWHPSVERLVRSAAEVYPAERLVCVQLTGMGDDGAAPMAELHRRGARTVAESEDTAVVFGMPKALADLGGASVILPVEQIARQLAAWAAQEELRACS